MGLLRFVKAADTKIFGATETAAAPPEQLKQEAEKHGLDVAQGEVKSEGHTEGGKAVLSGRAAATEEAEKIAPATDDPAGVATVQDDLAAAAKAAESKLYTVRPGDTLGTIAAAEYGPGHGGEYHRICCPIPPRSIRPRAAGSSASGLRACE
ncbi:MAG: peptidoglycan-binding protein LysM [Pseudomonadota bacterium]|nr:peptidoglycan-binding protein LysM [Pseudomonadota bacterium]